ncbi:protein of unknown function [Nocardioides alpinus]|uniref:DUF4397 domain-containing protein n=1 Tax=Nocardioides alpinus TaxID=748909 RepID=A0A1I1BHL0_9ACTN|nr:DUF4397 domain-containing protein [Nocardioides alpinus]PKH38418.1 DUF4397 domain-containing protein [Nocardioides alpinus]SFB49222.1 protein of unknown function [Nocardioides alpinus]
MKRIAWLSLVGPLAITGAFLAPSAQAAAQEDTAQLMVVQAVPDESITVQIDDATVSEGSATGDVLGPFTVPAGSHQVTFLDESGDVVVDTGVDLEAGSVQDLVVHRPAEVGGDPVATLYATSTETIAAGKARVLVAHTASVAPADVRIDGAVVFRNIANGEFATADVAEGAHVAELVPSGLTTRPILGPLDVTLANASATMIYAVGNAEDDSMDVITHSISLRTSADQAPVSINAGSAGLAADIAVTPFADGGAVTLQPGASHWTSTTAAMAALLTLAMGALGLRRRRATAASAS